MFLCYDKKTKRSLKNNNNNLPKTEKSRSPARVLFRLPNFFPLPINMWACDLAMQNC